MNLRSIITRLLSKFVKNRRIVSALISLGAIFAVVVGGRTIGMDWVTILLVSIIIIFSWIIALLYFQLRHKDDPAREAAPPAAPPPDRQEELQQFQEMLSTANELDAQYARGKAGWYLFIGPPGAGKTTSILNAGLDFPTGQKFVKLSEIDQRHRHLECYFSNSGIFLDVNGRYVTEETNKDVWQAFLRMLKKNRGARAINSVTVTVGMDDIIRKDENELEKLAEQLRSRLDGLMSELNWRVPVYLIFSKCDQIAGFGEFFQEFDEMQRKQIWGQNIPVDMQETENPGPIFAAEFDQLLQVLNERRIALLSATTDTINRRRIYTFPVQLALLKPRLQSFVAKLFHYNAYNKPYDKHIFRGFYLTSGSQSGMPQDPVNQAAGSLFGIPWQEIETQARSGQKSYFIHDLIENVIIPDISGGGGTRKWNWRNQLGRVAVLLVTGILLLGFVYSVYNAYSRSVDDKQEYQNLFDKFTHAKSFVNGEEITAYFQALSNFYTEMISRVETPPRLGWMIYRRDALRDKVHRELANELRPYIDQEIYIGELTTSLYSSNGNHDRAHECLNKFNDLRAFLLLSQCQSELVESEFEADFLSNHLTEVTRRWLQKKQVAEADFDLANLFSGFVTAFKADTSVKKFAYFPEPIEQARADLEKCDPVDRLYEQVKKKQMQRQKGKEQYLTLDQALSGSGRLPDYITCDYKIPLMYTREAWATVDSIIAGISRNPAPEPCLDIQDGTILGDSAKIMKDLKLRYEKEYLEEWERLWERIDYKLFRDLSAAEENLGELGNKKNSSLKRIIAAVWQQIQPLTDSPNRPRFDYYRSVQELESDSTWCAKVWEAYDKAGKWVKKVKDKKGDKQTVIDQARELLEGNGEVAKAMETVLDSPDNLDRNTRERLFEKPLIFAAQTVMNQAQEHLNSTWKDNIYPEIEKFIHLYPFSETADENYALIDDVTKFFGKDGILDQFVNVELEGFINQDYQPILWYGCGIGISRIRSQLEKAKRFREGLGIDGKKSFELKFTVETLALAVPRGANPGIKEITINIHGDELECEMKKNSPNPSQPDKCSKIFTWTGKDKASFIEYAKGGFLGIPFFKGKVAEIRQGDGPWGMFRLFDQAKIDNNNNSTTLTASFQARVGNDQIAFKFKIGPTSLNNPFNNRKQFFHFNWPQQQLN